jgi:hypothetical protein
MLQKFFTVMLLAALPLLAQAADTGKHHKCSKHKHHNHNKELTFGYFYLESDPHLDNETAITWNPNAPFASFSGGISLDPNDNSKINIKDPGIYFVTFSTSSTADNDNSAVRFDVHLNGIHVNGSAYSSSGIDHPIQDNGQVWFKVTQPLSNIQLLNGSGYGVTLNQLIIPIPPTDNPNVSASISITKMD